MSGGGTQDANVEAPRRDEGPREEQGNQAECGFSTPASAVSPRLSPPQGYP